MFLTHLVRAGWAKGLKTSVVAFDIAQFFPSLNHSILTAILSHFGFANCIVDFFSDYLVGSSTISVNRAKSAAFCVKRLYFKISLCTVFLQVT